MTNLMAPCIINLPRLEPLKLNLALRLKKNELGKHPIERNQVFLLRKTNMKGCDKSGLLNRFCIFESNFD